MRKPTYFNNAAKSFCLFVLSAVVMLNVTSCAVDDNGVPPAQEELKGSERLNLERKSNMSESTVYSFEYPTKSYTGDDILLSAKLIAWTPAASEEGDRIETVHVYNHYTITADRESPTGTLAPDNTNTQEQNMLEMLCLRDYGVRVGAPTAFVGHCVVIVPDYEGYGLTRDKIHPYMAQELTARQVADAVTYGLELYRKEAGQADSPLLPLSDDWRTFALGYSQGGSTTLAFQRYIEQQGLDDDLHFQGSICGDGPYDLVATARYYFDDNGDTSGLETPHRKGVVTMPVVMPLIFKGMFDAEPELKGYKIEEVLSQQFLDTGIIEWLNSKNYSTDDIDRMWVEQTENGLTANGRTYTPEQMAELFEVTTISNQFGTYKSVWAKAEKMFTPAAYAYMADADNFRSVPALGTDACTALHRALARNSVVSGWQPRHRIAFLHSRGDMVVPYANYLSFRDAHADGEDKIYKVWNDTFTTSDHVDGGFWFFVNMGMMHSFAQYFQWLAE